MAGLSPTQRTLRRCRELGLVADIVERYIQRPQAAFGIRKDLFGIIDIIALDPQRGVIGIQSCGQDYADHHRKLTVECAQATTDWLQTPGASLQLWGWRKVKVKRGGKAEIWSPRIADITLTDVAEALLEEMDGTA